MGRAVRCRYLGGNNGGIASSQSPLDSASALRRKLRSFPCSSFSAAIRYAGFASETGGRLRLPLNDVRSSECVAGCVSGRADRSFRHSEGYASTPWDPPWRGRNPKSGRVRVTSSAVILAQRGAHMEGGAVRCPWTRGPKVSVIQRPRQWPWNPMRRGMAVRCRYTGGTNGGILRLLTQALNDSRIWEILPVVSAPSK